VWHERGDCGGRETTTHPTIVDGTRPNEAGCPRVSNPYGKDFASYRL